MESMVNKNFWRDRPTFVTGGTGLLGSWLVKKLTELKADVVCLIRDWIPQCELVTSKDIEKVKVVRGDVRDSSLIERILGEYEIDTVFHLAAQTIVGIANRNPVSTLETNIHGTWTVLESCRRSSTVKQIIVASSDKAYGQQDILPYSEDTPLQGKHPYDVSKSCADLISQMYAHTFSIPVVITRCGNLYGGGDLNWNRIVPGTIRSILRGENPFIRSDGEYVRDYFYVEDAAVAYIMLAEKLADNSTIAGQAFNFSNEQPVTVIELVEIIIRLMNSKLEPVILHESSNEIIKQYLNAKKAKEILGWEPLFSLEEGLKLTIKWYKKFFREKDKI